MLRNNKKYIYLNLFLIFTLFFSELCLAAFTVGEILSIKNIFFFSVSAGAVITFIISLISYKKWGDVLVNTVLGVIFVCYVTETLLYRSFGYFYPPETVFGMAGDVLGSYSGGIFQAILSGITPILLLMIPLWLFSGLKRLFRVGYLKKSFVWIIIFLLGIGVHFFTAATLDKGTSGESSDSDYYGEQFDFNEGVKRFGLLESVRLNLMYSVNGVPDMSEKTMQNGNNRDLSRFLEKKYQIFDIDFELIKNRSKDKRIEDMCEYFSSVTPTEKNEYTGVFKGKNLIFICAEAFSPYSVSKDRTPTLYKLLNEGFVFSDYFQPSFGESTSGGEYSLLLGQIPKKDSGEKGMSFTLAPDEALKYSLPAFFSRAGYLTNGFHNNSYTYYGRNVTHPKMNMNWYGCYGCVIDEGLQLDLSTVLSPGWPRLDSELISATVDTYTNVEKPFFTYYLTVSGHNNYSFEENTAARRNRESVAGLPYSERVKAYLAAQYELEKAVSILVSELDKAGVLNDTVIALSNDHYPYGLSPQWQGNGGKDYISELYGGTVKSVSEREIGAFFIWCADMKKSVKVTKPAMAIDVLPTLLNLFGIEYDSRLLAGRDLLSECEGLVFFSDGSWKTENAVYDAKSGRITKISDVDDEYIKEMHTEVKNRIKYSKLFRQKNLVKYIMPYFY